MSCDLSLLPADLVSFYKTEGRVILQAEQYKGYICFVQKMRNSGFAPCAYFPASHCLSGATFLDGILITMWSQGILPAPVTWSLRLGTHIHTVYTVHEAQVESHTLAYMSTARLVADSLEIVSDLLVTKHEAWRRANTPRLPDCDGPGRCAV